MTIIDNNKSSYFCVKLKYSFLNSSAIMEESITLEMDLIFNKIKTNNIYKFKLDNQPGCILYFFGTDDRRRKGQISKLLNSYLVKKGLVDNFVIRSLLKKDFNKHVQKRLSQDITVSKPQKHFPEYTGEDISIFDDPNNWYDWQTDLYNRIFYQTGEIRKADTRSIIFIYDPQGNNGKSTFYKYLSYKYMDSLSYMCLGTTSQLMSAAVNSANSLIYVCDLPRTLSEQDKRNMSSLINVIEMVKNGVLTSNMYGRYNLHLQNSSHVIVSSNSLVNPEMLSQDRWLILEIKNKKLSDITKQTKTLFLKKKTS